MGNYTASTNILRDENNDIHYVTTPNARNVFERLTLGFQTGQHSFNIIGSYGTGKSSFLWAFEKNLKENKAFFAPLNGQFNGYKKFSFLKFIGESESFRTIVKNKLNLSPSEKDSQIFKALDGYYDKVNQRKEVLIIIVDEFGKFLEFASNHNPQKELYFIQQLAEYVNDPKKNILLITTLHQNFSSYAGKAIDRNEWVKVKGRLTDISFDEPIEQLLYIASERFKEFNLHPQKKSFNALFKIINASKLVSNASNLDKELARSLYPMDYLSAFILTSALQKYGQNERSLFSFLANLRKDSLKELHTDSEYFCIGNVFEYLINHLSQEINEGNNSHKPAWRAIYDALDKADALNETDYPQLKEIIVCIGLINLFGKSLGCLDKRFLVKYLQLTSGIEQAEVLIEKLIHQKIIKFFNHKNKLFFLEGTDLDIDKELLEAGVKITMEFNVVERFNYHVKPLTIPAKRAQYLTGSSRFFQFRISESLDTIEPQGEIDGYINVILSENRIKGKVKKMSESTNQAQVFAYLHDLSELKAKLFEVERYNYVIKKYPEDLVAKRILSLELNHALRQLRNFYSETIFSDNVTWYYQGKEESVSSKSSLNQFISQVALEVYHACPAYRNELVNREHLSPTILIARKALIRDLFENVKHKDLNYPTEKYPPQRTIYLSLLKATGIHSLDINSGRYLFTQPTDSSFTKLWEVSMDFLNGAKTVKRNITELYERLAQPPFKVKKGFADFWIPIFLLVKNEEYALFHIKEGYIPYLSPEILDLITKRTNEYSVKTYRIDGIKVNLYEKYKEITSISGTERGLESTFISIFSSFLNFYSSLPTYAKTTQKLSGSTIKFREAISNAIDPEDALFNEIPVSLGFSGMGEKTDANSLTLLSNRITEAVYELRTAYSDFLDRFEINLLKSLGLEDKIFPDYQVDIQNRFSSIISDILGQKQKKLIYRVTSNLDDRESYLKSIADVLAGKSISELTDLEEKILFNTTPGAITNLEKLINLHELRKSRYQERVLRFEIMEADGSHWVKQISYNEKDESVRDKISKQLKKSLSDDPKINEAVLISLLQETSGNG